MPVYTDQTGRQIELEIPPRRIVSLVPSQTELLFSLGLDEEVVGITKFCVHPDEWFRNKIKVGGTKQVKADTIQALHPDLIIANKEENVREQIEDLATHYPVWTSDVQSIDDAYRMIYSIGMIVNRVASAQRWISGIRHRFSILPRLRHSPRTAYLIWRQPYMTIGHDTFIHSMLEVAGFHNIFADKTRYPEITIDDLRDSGCEVVLLSSEPFPFKQNHADELKAALPTTKIVLVNGEMFSWYGSRMMDAALYLDEIIRQLSPSD